MLKYNQFILESHLQNLKDYFYEIIDDNDSEYNFYEIGDNFCIKISNFLNEELLKNTIKRIKQSEDIDLIYSIFAGDTYIFNSKLIKKYIKHINGLIPETYNGITYFKDMKSKSVGMMINEELVLEISYNIWRIVMNDIDKSINENDSLTISSIVSGLFAAMFECKFKYKPSTTMWTHPNFMNENNDKLSW